VKVKREQECYLNFFVPFQTENQIQTNSLISNKFFFFFSGINFKTKFRFYTFCKFGTGLSNIELKELMYFDFFLKKFFTQKVILFLLFLKPKTKSIFPSF